jgi:hypothetical protein
LSIRSPIPPYAVSQIRVGSVKRVFSAKKVINWRMAEQAAAPADELAKGRLTRVFKFLKALNELRNPVPRDLSAYSQILWLDRWPVHPT